MTLELLSTASLPIPRGRRTLRLMLRQNATAKGDGAAVAGVGKKSSGVKCLEIIQK